MTRSAQLAAAVSAWPGLVPASCNHPGVLRTTTHARRCARAARRRSLSLHWKFVTADRLTEIDPQSSPGARFTADTLYIGSQSGWLFSLRAATHQRWRKQIGTVVSTPIVSGRRAARRHRRRGCSRRRADRRREWRYESAGPIDQSPCSGDSIIFANERSDCLDRRRSPAYQVAVQRARRPEGVHAARHAACVSTTT